MTRAKSHPAWLAATPWRARRRAKTEA
jgi:hypothetical protein